MYQKLDPIIILSNVRQQNKNNYYNIKKVFYKN